MVTSACRRCAFCGLRAPGATTAPGWHRARACVTRPHCPVARVVDQSLRGRSRGSVARHFLRRSERPTYLPSCRGHCAAPCGRALPLLSSLRREAVLAACCRGSRTSVEQRSRSPPRAPFRRFAQAPSLRWRHRARDTVGHIIASAPLASSKALMAANPDIPHPCRSRPPAVGPPCPSQRCADEEFRFLFSSFRSEAIASSGR